uniref:Uncharacterized protein n=1 Tax=Arundo donax TaxID=35708 RepID=A0A0A9HIK9_ARUDO
MPAARRSRWLNPTFYGRIGRGADYQMKPGWSCRRRDESEVWKVSRRD